MKKYLVYCKVVVLLLVSCDSDFLDLKPDRSLIIPSTLQDFQALLDNDMTMNMYGMQVLGEISADDYYLSFEDWEMLYDPYQKNGYIWEKDIYNGQELMEWNKTYQKILYSNVVLDGLEKLERIAENASNWDNVKGSALFYRAWSNYQLSQVFCEDYSNISENTLGIALRRTSDIEEKIIQVSVKETYEHIINDLKEAILLLPEKALFRTRPGKAIANAVLAKVYLQMAEYEEALKCSEAYLSIYNQLIDYNDLNVEDEFPFPDEGVGNVELPFYELMSSTLIFDEVRVDTSLYELYDNLDLRKSIFFYEIDGVKVFGGSYTGYDDFIGAPATDEMYLIFAECATRVGKHEQALEKLNLLLKARYVKGMYNEIYYESDKLLLFRVLEERRKELLFRGIRWSDLRRFRNDPYFSKKLVRKLGNSIYELESNSPRYMWPIPDNAITLGKYKQNQR